MCLYKSRNFQTKHSFEQDGRPQVEEMYSTRSTVSLSIYFVLKYMRHLSSEDVEE